MYLFEDKFVDGIFSMPTSETDDIIVCTVHGVIRAGILKWLPNEQRSVRGFSSNIVGTLRTLVPSDAGRTTCL